MCAGLDALLILCHLAGDFLIALPQQYDFGQY
jgi:hypothetical protein